MKKPPLPSFPMDRETAKQYYKDLLQIDDEAADQLADAYVLLLKAIKKIADATLKIKDNSGKC